MACSLWSKYATALLCSNRISSAVQFERASIQRVRALRKTNETPRTRSSAPLAILKSAISLRYLMRRAPCKMAGSCAGLVILEPFAETRSFRNDGTLPAANLQLVPLRILEEKCIVTGTVTPADFRTLE